MGDVNTTTEFIHQPLLILETAEYLLMIFNLLTDKDRSGPFYGLAGLFFIGGSEESGLMPHE